jgi:xanthine/uracil permease
MVEYGIDEKPPTSQSVALGLQHYLTMIGSNIAVPLVLAGAMGMPADATARLVGTFFVVSGIATLAQTTIGNRYPLVQGASFAILAPALAIVGVVASSGGGWETMIVELQGAMIVAGALQILIGYLGLFGYLKRFLSPVVIAPVIALIGLALFNVPQITDPSMQSIWLFGLTLVLIIGFSQYLSETSRLFKLYPVLLGLASAWLIATVLSVTGVISTGSSAFVDLSRATETSLLQPIVPLQWGVPQFTPAFIVGIFAGVVASMIESFGDYYAVARISGEKAPSAQRINHGLGMEGIGNVFAGLMASRYVVQVGAVVMLVAGYLGVVGGLVTTIPSPIVGGLFLVMFAQIIGVGLSQLQYVDLNQNRNVFIIGITLLSGLSIPSYVSNLAGDSGAVAIQALLADVPVVGVVLGTELVAQTVFVVGTTGIAVGGIIGFLLDLTIPGTPEGRGLTAWEDLTEDDSDFETVQERYRSRSTSQTSPKTGDD